MLKLHWALINRGHLITWGFGAGVLSHAFPGSSESKEFAWNAGDLGSIPELERSPEKEMATHSSTLASKIPWMGDPGRLQSMGWQRVRHNWGTSLSFFYSSLLEKEMATHSCPCLENPMNRGAWWATVYGVAMDMTKQLTQTHTHTHTHTQ